MVVRNCFYLTTIQIFLTMNNVFIEKIEIENIEIM